MTPEEIVERAAEVLVGHQRMDAGSCLCGWGELGRSHAKHQAQALATAGLVGDLGAVWDEGWNASADYMSDAYDGPDEVTNPYEAKEVTP